MKIQVSTYEYKCSFKRKSDPLLVRQPDKVQIIYRLFLFSAIYFKETYKAKQKEKQTNVFTTYVRNLLIRRMNRKNLYQGIHQVWYCEVSGLFEDLKFKISEGSDQNQCFPGSAMLAVSAKLRQQTGQSQDNFNSGPSLLKF